MRTLPDLLRLGLDVVFVGINPGERSAALGHYYAHPGNGFWGALAASPLVDEPLTCLDDRCCPECWRIGFTDVVKRVVTDSTLVTAEELRAAAPVFRRRIAYASPRAVCFTSVRAFEAVFPGARTAHGWGRQPATLAGAEAWLMPSTSGRAIAFRPRVHEVLRDLADALGRGPNVELASARSCGLVSASSGALAGASPSVFGRTSADRSVAPKR